MSQFIFSQGGDIVEHNLDEEEFYDAEVKLEVLDFNPISGACGGKLPQKVDKTRNLINIVSTTSVFLDFS